MLPQSIKGVLARRVNETLCVLFLRNDRNEWELPGGRPERGERLDQSLSREFIEETGLRVKIDRCIHSGVFTILPPHVPQITRVSIAIYGCFLEETNPMNPAIVLSDEHCGARWIGIDDVDRMEDIPDIYKISVLNWKRELEARAE